MSGRLNNQLIRLTLLLQLERRARQAPAKELPYVLVNETAELIPYRQAVLWRKDRAKIEAVSGVAKPEQNSPYSLWLTAVLKHIGNAENVRQIIPLTKDSIPPELAKDQGKRIKNHLQTME